MAFVQGDLDALDSAYKTGAVMVRLADGRTHQLRSVAEYERLRRLIQDAITLAAGEPVTRLVRVGHASGVT